MFTRQKTAFFTLLSVLAFAGLFLLVNTAKSAEPNLIANPSVETPQSGQPANWSKNKWGTNTATFTYPQNGQNGTRSVKVNMTAYTSGDAKWYFNPVNVEPNHTYTYSDYYKSNVESQLVAQIEATDSTLSYVYLATANSSTAWENISVNFTTPANAKKLTVFHLIDRVGNVQTDNFSLTDITAPSPTPTVAPTPTLSPTPSATPSPTPTATPTPTVTPSPTVSPTPSPTVSPSPTVTPSPTPTPDPSNLISNPSFEAGTALPENWFSSKWGTNQVQFSYPDEAQDGSRGAKVTVSSYTSGDAKWFFEPVAVIANETYVFSDYSKSDVETEIVSQVEDTSGNLSYYWIGNVPSSTNWQLSTFEFTTPSNANKLTIFHLIHSVGTLNVDNFTLAEKVSAPIVITDNVPNNSVEQVSDTDQNKPAGWSHDSWGTNTPVFSYLSNLGFTGTHSVKTEVTSYTSGDAKWYYASQPVIPGQKLSFTDHYQSNVVTHFAIMYTNLDDTFSYAGLKDAPASAGWATYSDMFTVPANVKAMTIFHVISSVGFLITDDYHVMPYTPGPFNRGLVSLTFDDGWETQYSAARPAMQQYNFPATFYISTGFLGTPDYMTNAMVQTLKDEGNHIAAHTVTHPHLPTLTDQQLAIELGDSKSYLQTTFGTDANDFASPFGEVDARVMTFVKNYYTTHRGVLPGFNYKDDTFDIYDLKVQNILNSTTTAEVQGWINQALAEKSWLILVYHAVLNNADTYDVTPANFASQMQALSQSEATVVTIDQAISEILPQF